jgi:hypothetical protein
MNDDEWPEHFYEEVFGHGIKLKIVLLESTKLDCRNLQKAYSPIIKHFGSTCKEFGDFHSAIIIGTHLSSSI